MMLPQDTITATAVATDDEASAPLATDKATVSGTLTPYKVLRSLPNDATPAQQDSAIQAAFQPNEIHYSLRPDTLHIPGHGVGKSLKEVNLPQYYRESFFSNDSLLHPELSGGRYGLAGDPVPYTIRNDDLISSFIIGCILLVIVFVAQSKQFMRRQTKHFFHPQHSEGLTVINETSTEIRAQLFLTLLTSLQLGLIAYIYTKEYVGQTFAIQSEYQMIGIFWAIIVGYFTTKLLAYNIVNKTFFDDKSCLQWNKTLMFITSVECILLFPALLIEIYFSLELKDIAYYCAFVFIFVKILSFYKAFQIFFGQISACLQFFLYLCTLEITPLAAVIGIIDIVGQNLRINF